MAIISLSGKKQSGKSTVGKIINIILNSPQLNNEGVLNFLKKDNISSKDWHLKMFAEKLKQIACLLIGCTMEQLEDEEFKNTVLPEWSCWSDGFSGKLYLDKNDAIHEAVTEWDADERYVELREMTPRLLLQLLGTECGREIIHPQIWVNSLFADYKFITRRFSAVRKDDKYFVPEGHGEHSGKQLQCAEFEYDTHPNWIITDMRFPNELEAVKSKGGITIRVDRHLYENEDGRHLWFDREDKSNILFIYKSDYSKEESKAKYLKELSNQQHKSETALDEAEFDYTINNDGTLEDLINKVREILTKEKFI